MTGKIKILVIDDDKTLCENFRDILEEDGYEVLTAQTKFSALKIIAKTYVDLILVDIRLPDGNGLEVIKMAKEKIPYVKPIVITAYATLENAVEAIKTGIYGYILKPFEIDEVKKTVKDALKRFIPEVEIFRGQVRTWQDTIAIIAENNESFRSWLSKSKDKYNGKYIKVVLISQKKEPKV